MAKEFKDFDKMFSRFKGKALQLIAEHDNAHIDAVRCNCAANLKTVWVHRNTFTELYSADAIAAAVYTSITALNWQRFRVGLKGLTTSEKLYCLEWWWRTFTATEFAIFDVNVIRVNNYLGALKRGGFLDSDLKVIK